MKIGIYAGTFDPVHKGHIAFAESAVASAGLDRVVIVAEKDPYRKKPHTSWDHRQAMVEHATQSISQVDHDYAFANSLAHRHTMQDMLDVAQRHYGDTHEYWFLAGSDIFEHIHQWDKMAQSDQYGGFIVALRDDHTTEWLGGKISQLSLKDIDVKVHVIKSRHPHISSSHIRELVKRGEYSVDLPPAVSDYILEHGLYL